MTAAVDEKGRRTAYEYDRVVKKNVDGEITEYTYTINGLLKTATDKNGTVTYTYDDMDGLISVVLADGTEINYSYDDSLRLTKVSTPDRWLKYEK